MDSRGAIYDTTDGIIVHTRGSHVMQCRFHARAPFLWIAHWRHLAETCALHGSRKKSVGVRNASQLEVSGSPAYPRQRPSQRVHFVAELDPILGVSRAF